MSQELLNELMSKSESLSVEEKLQLMRYLSNYLKSDDHSIAKTGRKWYEIQGKAIYPLMAEDAQSWVSQTRQVATEQREQIIHNSYES